tara:strand:+ start:657 stop:893 length:237 start_codon:yes stop_codon:yes gene_type:complete
MLKKTKNRESYHRQYYRKQEMNKLRKVIQNLRSEHKLFMSSPEGIAYKKRLTKEYYKQYRIDNKEKLRAYQKEYLLTY